MSSRATECACGCQNPLPRLPYGVITANFSSSGNCLHLRSTVCRVSAELPFSRRSDPDRGLSADTIEGVLADYCSLRGIDYDAVVSAGNLGNGFAYVIEYDDEDEGSE